MISVQTRI